ncbi:MAG: MerR family transcriptional regulator [Desulfomonilaceae bacterium]
MTAQRQLLQIGEIASQAGTTIRTVRYYLEEGLIESAERSPGGFYLFEPHIVDTVRFIQKLKNLGMSLNEIKALYQVRREKPTGNEAYPVVLKRLQDRLCDMNKKIGEYEELREELEEAIDLVQQCHGCRMKPNRENCLACDIVKKRNRIPLPFGAIL